MIQKTNICVKIPVILFFIVNICGCKTLDKGQIRENHVELFKKSLNEKKIKKEIKYSLDDCLREALRNNLDIKAKLVEKNITSLDKKASFSYFLPRIDLNYQTQSWSKEPLMKTGTDSSGHGRYIATHDDSYISSTLNIGFSLLNPSAWFLYSMRKKNEDISVLSFNLTRQMISMRITAHYFLILALERLKENLNYRINSASVLNDQIQHFYSEGLIPEWEKTEGEAYLLSCKRELKKAENDISEQKSELLLEMGCSPLDSISLEKNNVFKSFEFKLEDLILEALSSHPVLYIQDKVIDITNGRVKAAIANFLPDITGYANLNNTTNSFVKYSTYWISGIQGVWSLFNGFKNVNDYKIAKQKKTLEFIKREKACLSIMLSVTKAYLACQDSVENLKVAEILLKASRQKSDEIEIKWKEGMESYSNYCRNIAEKDHAEFFKIQAELLSQVCIANLYSVTGKTYMGKENTNHEL